MSKRVKKPKMILWLLLLLMLIYLMQSQVSYAEETVSGQETVIEEEDVLDEEETGSEEDEDEAEVDENQENMIEKYILTIPESDGKNGYYVSFPEITIKHISESGVTKYQLFHGKELVQEDVLSEKDTVITLQKTLLQEGKNLLKLWMEDEEGNVLADTEYQKEILIDTKPPEVKLQLPNGFQTWYKAEVTLSVQSDDEVSQVGNISCMFGGKQIADVQKSNASFVLQTASNKGEGVELFVSVSDHAGNITTKKEIIYIDNTAPKIWVKGVEDYMITSQPVNISYFAEEDNILENVYAEIIWEKTDKKKKVLKTESCNTTNLQASAEQLLSEDGIYEIYFAAFDKAGYQSEKRTQIIIDQKNPQIKFIDEQDQQYLKYFQWNYEKEEIVEDFTTYTYEILLDGRIYPLGEKIKKEGKHLLEIKAKDAAGNQATASARFWIDHTEPEITFLDIEDGETYEKEKTFKVALIDQDDKIEQIELNGEKQELVSGSKAYQYTVNEAQDYTVSVRASDKAGNVAEESLFFTVEAEKTMVQKIVEPIKKKLISGEKKESSEEKDSEKVSEKAGGMWLLLGIIPTAAVFAIWIWQKKKKAS